MISFSVGTLGFVGSRFVSSQIQTLQQAYLEEGMRRCVSSVTQSVENGTPLKVRLSDDTLVELIVKEDE